MPPTSWHRHSLRQHRVRLTGLLVLAALVLTACASLPGPPARLAPLPSPVVFAGVAIPVDNPAVRARISDWYNFYLSKPWQVARWLGRANRVFPIVETALSAEGLPRDLEYVAVAESDLDPRAVSGAGAAGLWQFTVPTAKDFGIPMNRFVDERFDMSVESAAAAAYFRKTAATIPNSWLLRVAAFNLGVNGVTQRVMRQKTDDYWKMVFPPETESYVPRIIAIKLLMQHARQLGIRAEDRLPELARVTISVPAKPIYLSDVAVHLGMSFRQLWEDNPQIWKPYLTPGRYTLSLPVRFRSEGVRIAAYLSSLPYERATYTLPDSQTVSAAAQHLGITADELATWNGLSANQTLAKGRQLDYWRPLS